METLRDMVLEVEAKRQEMPGSMDVGYPDLHP